jgi:rare lipoprotein A
VPAEPAPPDIAGPAPVQAPPYSVVGTARYYANRFNGRKTASGEIFSQKKLTAAHPTLPFGTRVKVENLANSKSVIVKINDRCRKHEKVFIDLSRAAALELDFIRQGTAKVRLTVLKDDPSSEVPAVAKD